MTPDAAFLFSVAVCALKKKYNRLAVSLLALHAIPVFNSR